MPSTSDLSRAANILLKVQEHLAQKGHVDHDDDLQSMITLFENPIFKQMVKLQNSIETLNAEAKKENFDGTTVDFSPESGALLLGGDEIEGANLQVEDCNVEDFVKETAHGRQIEEIDLFKYPTESLGFSVVGLRSDHRGDLGIFVQDIKPGGMACRDGRLKESDQILAINDKALSPSVSHQQAITMLQKSKGLVKLIVARGGFPQSLVGGGNEESATSSQTDLSSLSQDMEDDNEGTMNTNWSHVESIELSNVKGNGLGFGIVGGRATGGVVVKTIVPGGAAALDGRLRSGDHILNIGDTDLRQMSSEQVALVLRQCGATVRLLVARTDDDDDDDVITAESFGGGGSVMNDDVIKRKSDVDENSSLSSLSSEDIPKEFFDIELVKDSKGLGITIHGFLSEDEENEGETGVFVKSITPGSASDIDGRIQIGDQLIAVDGKRLDGEDISSEQAVEILQSTGVVVRLTMARRQQPQQPPPYQMDDFDPRRDESENEEEENSEIEDFSGDMSESDEVNMKRKWSTILGHQFHIVVAQLRKFNYTSGLGISLEGTIDFDQTPHHYLRSILPEGPVGRNGKLQAGDELLEVNGKRLMGVNHVEVVCLLKQLPLHVRIVCARLSRDHAAGSRDHQARDSVVFEERDGEFLQLDREQLDEGEGQQQSGVGVTSSTSLSPTSSSEADTISQVKLREISPMDEYEDEVKVDQTSTRLAADTHHEEVGEKTEADVGEAWLNELIYIELTREENTGLGFSILELPEQEYGRTAVVVRSLLEGGIAEKDGRLEPGDRIISVNNYDLTLSDLDHAVLLLKSIPSGVVRIGVVKPRPQYQTPNHLQQLQQEDEEEEVPDVVMGGEYESQQAYSSASSTTTSYDEQQMPPPTPLLPALSAPEPEDYEEEEERQPTQPQPLLNNAKSGVEVKQIRMSGMTAIALTSTSSHVPQPSHQQSPPPHYDSLHSNNDVGGRKDVPVIPPKPHHYSAPSWQTAVTVNRAKPPLDGYERVVHMEKGDKNLGVNVRPDKDGDGLVVVGVVEGAALHLIGEPKVGDMIRRVNNDSAVGLGLMQARSLILNHSKFTQHLTISYIPAQHIDAFKRGIPFSESSPMKPPPNHHNQHSNRKQHFAAIKSIFEDSIASSDTSSRGSPASSPVLLPSMWGSYQRVEILREEGEELGLKIVGGCDVEMPTLSNGQHLQGIFVESVERDGALDRDGRIKAGDKILKVGTFDLKKATHQQAIDAFAQSTHNPTTFIVQTFISKSVKRKNDDEAESVGGTATEELLMKYAHVEGEKKVVRLVKGPAGLGISMAGSKDNKVFVVGVKPDGAAGRSGQIKVGDHLLEINNQPLDGANNNQLARELILNQTMLTMVVCRQQARHDDDDVTHDVTDARVIKLVKDFKGLGFSLMESTQPPGRICVKSIALDGAAQRDGRLRRGDVIISVDDQPLDGCSCETARAILKQTRGVVKLLVKTGEGGGEVMKMESGVESWVELDKGRSGLGLSIVGGRDSLLNSILVHTVYEGGAAAKDGRLWPGDRILMVNDYDVTNATHDEAIDVLQRTTGTVRLLVVRDEHRENINKEEENDLYEYINVTLHKRKGLGLSIIGRRNHPGVYISDLIQGGVAQQEGSICKGDRIISIDGTDVKFATQETVASLLKKAKKEVVMVMGRLKSGNLPDDIVQTSSNLINLPHQPDININKDELALHTYTSKDREEHQIRFVEIHKSPQQPLGVSIAGGMSSPLGDVPIFVAMVQPTGPAAKHLNVNDMILSVNGRSTDNKTHDDVVQMLKGSDDSIVLMQVREGGEEISKLSEYLSEATSNVNDMLSTWDPSVKHLQSGEEKEPIDIELHRGTEGLGISIAGGYGSPHGNIPIFVKSVSQLGAAAEEGRLKKGDQILSVNGEDLNGYTHEEAAEALRRKTNLIILKIIPAS